MRLLAPPFQCAKVRPLVPGRRRPAFGYQGPHDIVNLDVPVEMHAGARPDVEGLLL